ncbi:CPCC family cysteine-rich protein [Rosenbergiella nectarea]|uniref:CPCC family cysteine-rich protein n=1 Tax=Rosenbergiella nectarea TaxID=988801 RepID=UPI00240D1D72|nr:CPCC family cysteine-rich protein [Rosenbergiella nectarea]
MINNLYPCPCCGKLVFESLGEHDICPNCNWEDDPVQEEDQTYGGGANVMSLNEAGKAYAEGNKVK